MESFPGPDRYIPEMASLMSKKGIKIFHQNVRGLCSNSLHICELMQSYNGIDILTLSETHLTEHEPEPLFEIPGYSFVSRCRSSGKDGGVAVYISSKLCWERRIDLENDEVECIWIEVKQNQSKGWLIAVIYRPPVGSKHLNKNFNTCLNDMLSLASEMSKEIILLGDVNVNYLVPDDGREFKSIMNLFGFSQIINKQTRITQSTKTLIDIIATNNEAWYWRSRYGWLCS